MLLDRPGGGGMGTVWRATDRLLGRTVAVKEMHVRATGEQAARVRREAHTIARLPHPNVVDVHDLVSQDARRRPRRCGGSPRRRRPRTCVRPGAARSA
ncbi:protein kinase domain-containing protein [Nonomuraea sp. SBT364]|uniref:protein kinase domain-containing protein n=1 Tax=Nonomuraea sp. SBT364 TaxID=1580530 RepID=UPI00066DF263|nr:protein kinase [Nonomuraea sp. SBT364]